MDEIRIIIRTVVLLILGIILFILVPITVFAFLGGENPPLMISLWMAYTVGIIFLFGKLTKSWSIKKETDKLREDAELAKTRNLKNIEDNVKKGIFGPTKREKIGGLIVASIIVISLSLVISSNKVQWYYVLGFDALFIGIIWLGLFSNNLYLKNGELYYKSSPENKAIKISILSIIGVKKIYQPGGQGVPSPALSLDNNEGIRFEINIEKWSITEVTAFIKFLKEKNNSLIVDPAFEELVSTFKTDEFFKLAKTYSKNETKAAWKAGLMSLVYMLLFYAVWIIILLLKK
jgi:hypothetical protein